MVPHIKEEFGGFDRAYHDDSQSQYDGKPSPASFTYNRDQPPVTTLTNLNMFFTIRFSDDAKRVDLIKGNRKHAEQLREEKKTTTTSDFYRKAVQY